MQLNLNLPVQMPKEAYSYGSRASGETHGVVLTKPHVVELILDLVGYDRKHDLCSKRLLDPSCGNGAFLVPAVTRLLASARARHHEPLSLEHAVVAYDIDSEHVARTRELLRGVLHANQIRPSEATRLVDAWIHEGDFLLAEPNRRFDFVVGNPPYVRIEQLAAVLQAEYRRRYSSLYDRADLYVAFIERGLSLLTDTGMLGFICADRWISNRYGAPLRRLIAENYRVFCYVDLHRASPFESEVIAYPSIFVIGRGESGDVPVVRMESASADQCTSVVEVLQKDGAPGETGVRVEKYETWFKGNEPWILSSPDHLRALRAMEVKFPKLEQSATVGIGVATGNDKLYIVDEKADIEPDRLVPLVMREDIDRGKIRASGRCVINTFEDGAGVVNLERYPRLRRYLQDREPDVKRRHVAKRNPDSWFRTIDRVYPQLVTRPKLLIPDISGANEVVFDKGQYFPHHNLYYVVSECWDMEVLGALLSSKIALFFVWSYAVKMRGGYLRFQAQYLRRIRIPEQHSIDRAMASRLRDAFRNRHFNDIDELARQAYDLDEVPVFDFVDTRK